MPSSKRKKAQVLGRWEDHKAFHNVVSRNQFVDLCIVDLQEQSKAEPLDLERPFPVPERGCFKPDQLINLTKPRERDTEARCAGCGTSQPLVTMDKVDFAHLEDAVSYLCSECCVIWKSDVGKAEKGLFR